MNTVRSLSELRDEYESLYRDKVRSLIFDHGSVIEAAADQSHVDALADLDDLICATPQREGTALTEVDRLREALREAVDHHEDQYEAWKGSEPLYQTGEEALVSDYHRERADRLKAKLEGEDD